MKCGGWGWNMETENGATSLDGGYGKGGDNEECSDEGWDMG